MKDDDGDDEVEDAYEDDDANYEYCSGDNEAKSENDGDDDDANIGKMEMFFVECLYIWNKFE